MKNFETRQLTTSLAEITRLPEHAKLITV